jgi:hypothetical protein
LALRRRARRIARSAYRALAPAEIETLLPLQTKLRIWLDHNRDS